MTASLNKVIKLLFWEALKLAGETSPEKVLYVGDNLEADIKGALNAGLTPLLINVKNDLEPPEGVVKIKKLSALLALLGLESD